jgi:protein NrfC
MNTQQDRKNRGTGEGVPRRDFLKIAGIFAVSGGTSDYFISTADGKEGIPASGGYILVDTKKCQGCVSCMLACSLVHEGETNLSLSRIQVIQNPFEKWPDDLTIEQCRQCVDPACVNTCPTGAIQADTKHGNVRAIDTDKCIGCGACIKSCPYKPSRPVMAPDKNFDNNLKARKCDLCAGAKHHWDKTGGGPGKKQACVEVCPVGAITFTTKIPVQKGDSGYKVNLRRRRWRELGYPSY